MKLSIFCPLALKTPIHAPKKLGFRVYFTHEMGSNINETPKGTSVGRNGSRGVLIISLSAIVCEKSRGNKKCDEEEGEEERHIIGLGITVKWQFTSAFLSFFWGCQKSALIAILKTKLESYSGPMYKKNRNMCTQP